jgi:hypothetical protein
MHARLPLVALSTRRESKGRLRGDIDRGTRHRHLPGAIHPPRQGERALLLPSFGEYAASERKPAVFRLAKGPWLGPALAFN